MIKTDSKSIEAQVATFHSDCSWMHKIMAFSDVNQKEFCDYWACFFADIDPPCEEIVLPKWATDLKNPSYEKMRNQICQERSWRDSIIGQAIMAELMAKAEYKMSIHKAWLQSLQKTVPGHDVYKILDYGAAVSSYSELALIGYSNVYCTLADVPSELDSYVKFKFETWQDRVDIHFLRTVSPGLHQQCRIRVDYTSIKDQYNAIVISSVLEHVLDPIGLLLHLLSRLKEDGLMLAVYGNYIEGDWHTPEAYYLRPWSFRLLSRVATRIDKNCWQKKRGLKPALTLLLFKLLHPFLVSRARQYAYRYFREHGEEVCREVRESDRRDITVEDLLSTI